MSPVWAAVLVPFLVMGVLFLSYFPLIVYGFIGAAVVLRGRDFRYAMVGRQVENYLELRA